MTKISEVSFKPQTAQESQWKTILDLVYPPGSVYMSFNSTTPVLLFGGNWTKIENCFLYCGNDSFHYNNDNTGGSNDAIVPTHTHNIGVAQSTHNLTHQSHVHAPNDFQNKETGEIKASHYIRATSSYLKNIEVTQTNNARYRVMTIDRWPEDDNGNTIINDEVQSEIWRQSNSTKETTIPQHTFTTNVSVRIDPAGESATNANMPAYQKVHCWRRIG